MTTTTTAPARCRKSATTTTGDTTMTTATAPAPATATTTAPATDAAAVAECKRIIAARASALALNGAERTRNLDNVRLIAAAAALGLAGNRGARIAVDVKTKMRGGGFEAGTITATVADVLRSIALGCPVVGSSTLA